MGADTGNENQDQGNRNRKRAHGHTDKMLRHCEKLEEGLNTLPVAIIQWELVAEIC